MTGRVLRRYSRKLRNGLWEMRLNTRTWGVDRQQLHQDARGYAALSFAAIWAILRHLQLGPQDVFVDIGCGKGRVVCCAARLPLREVLGIEINPELAARARENARRMRGRRAPVRILDQPAQEVNYSQGTVFYLFNPFGADTLCRVVERLSQSPERDLRGLQLVYVLPQHEAVLEQCGWLQKWDHWPPQKPIALDHPVSFWRSEPAGRPLSASGRV